MDALYGFDKYNVILDCASENFNNWIKRYLYPFFEVQSQGETNYTWVVKVSFDEADRQSIGQEYHYMCNLPETRYSEYPELKTEYCSDEREEYYVVAQQDPDTLLSKWWFTIDKNKSEVKIWVSLEQLESKYVIARLIRSLIVGMACEDGWIIMHSSCVSTSKGGFITLGEKRMGKTAVLVSALHIAGNCYVANDKVLVKKVDGKVVAQGLPYSPAVKKSLLKQYGLSQESSYIFQGTKSKVRFLVSDFCELLHTSVKPKTTVDKIVLPRYTDEIGLYTINELDEGLISSSIIVNICDFQPVWNKVFKINKAVPEWLKQLDTYMFNYNDDEIGKMVVQL